MRTIRVTTLDKRVEKIALADDDRFDFTAGWLIVENRLRKTLRAIPSSAILNVAIE